MKIHSSEALYNLHEARKRSRGVESNASTYHILTNKYITKSLFYYLDILLSMIKDFQGVVIYQNIQFSE